MMGRASIPAFDRAMLFRIAKMTKWPASASIMRVWRSGSIPIRLLNEDEILQVAKPGSRR
jgi:hypothetical protein